MLKITYRSDFNLNVDSDFRNVPFDTIAAVLRVKLVTKEFSQEIRPNRSIHYRYLFNCHEELYAEDTTTKQLTFQVENGIALNQLDGY